MFLSADKPLLHVNSVGALDSTGSAIAAAHIPNFFPKTSEINDGLMVVAAEIIIGQKTQHIRHRQALGTLPFAFVTHAAVKGADILIPGIEHLLVQGGIGFCHGPYIHLKLLYILHREPSCIWQGLTVPIL